MVGADDLELARRWTLVNAQRHDGKANLQAVIGKLIAEKPELKLEIEELMQIVEELVGEINRLSPEEQRSELDRLGPPEKLKVEEERRLPELPDVDKYPYIVTRFAPNPNGPLHLGHVRTALLCYEYARKHAGRFILRFEDTNPANARSEMYDLIREDLEWLGIGWDEEYMQSDRMEIYYEFAVKLLEAGDAYVCVCDPERFKELRDESEPCPCRELDSEEHLERWRGMIEGKFEEGEAAVRMRTNLELSNPALRDWPALRISTSSHPQVGNRYRVWPLYNFSVSIDDHEMDITHVIRGKEHEVNELRQKQLFDFLNWDYPTVLQHGRLSIPGTVLSKTKMMEGIEKGKFEGYDDVRLATISALRRRGFAPESLKEVILNVGMTKVDSTLSWDTLFTENRRIIDERANRYFFVPNPTELRIHDVPDLDEAHLRLHPDHRERGDRTLPLAIEDGSLIVQITTDDFLKMEKGETVRLKDLLNFDLVCREPPEGKFSGFELLLDVPKIQWVSADPVEVGVLRPDGSRDFGLAEPAVGELSEGEVIQFERYGFVKVEETEPEIVVIFAHR